MRNWIRSMLVLTAAICVTAAMSFAASPGEAIFKANCQTCHGPSGTPNPGIAKMLGVMPVSDPAMKKLTEAEMIAAVKNGKGKMPKFSGKLSDAQIKDVVVYFRTLK